MEFIERWLHVSPDGGSGTYELALFLIPVLAAATAYARRRMRAVRHRDPGHTRASREERRWPPS